MKLLQMAQSQHQPLSLTLYTQFNHQVLSFLPSKVFPNLAILIQVTITPSLADSHTLLSIGLPLILPLPLTPPPSFFTLQDQADPYKE